MESDKYHEVKDVKWENTGNYSESGIKFRKIRRRRASDFLKVIAFILIAAVSGGISGAYVSQKQKTYVYPQNNQNLVSQGQNNNANSTNRTQNSINNVAEMVVPTVVAISNSAQGFIGDIPQGSGSGIIFDPNGYIVTNNHVIEGADKITVKLASGKTLDAKLIGSDSKSDLAVIRVNAQNLPSAKFGNSAKVKVGDIAIAIGNPLGEYAGSVTAGIISAVNRKIRYQGAIYNVFQTDAAINPGNSGGALCNEAGEVIGINSLKISNTENSENAEGIGFAITIDGAKEIISSLVKYGKVTRAPSPYLGIKGATAVSEQNNSVKGVYVSEVIQGTGASAAGIKPTDIITAADGKDITTMEELQDIIEKHKVGDVVSCRVWRNGKTIKLNVILSELKNNK